MRGIQAMLDSGISRQTLGFLQGMWEGAKGLVFSVLHMLRHPTETLAGIWYAIQNPGRLWHALKEPFVNDWTSGNYGRAIGRGMFEVIMLMIPGVGEARVVIKAAEAARIAAKGKSPSTTLPV